MDRTAIAGVILAGGQGRRMAGQDKGWVDLGGRPLIAHVLERFAPQVGEVMISANRNLPRYAALGVRVVPDVLPGYQGPLAGLHAALAATDVELLASVPCDAPFLPLDLVARLCAQLRSNGAEACAAQVHGRLHPVFCLCRRSVLPSLERALAAGERKVETWCRDVHAVVADFDDPAAFRNVNTVEDLHRLA